MVKKDDIIVNKSDIGFRIKTQKRFVEFFEPTLLAKLLANFKKMFLIFQEIWREICLFSQLTLSHFTCSTERKTAKFLTKFLGKSLKNNIVRAIR